MWRGWNKIIGFLEASLLALLSTIPSAVAMEEVAATPVVNLVIPSVTMMAEAAMAAVPLTIAPSLADNVLLAAVHSSMRNWLATSPASLENKGQANRQPCQTLCECFA